MKLFQIFLVILLFTSCQEEQKCKFKPTPVFKPATSKITNHSFESKKTKATEKATFPNGVHLELFQTICNNSQQEYHFYIKGDFRNQPDDFWVNQAAEQFFNMANSGKEVEPIAAWGIEIQKDTKRFFLGEKVKIQEGISIEIDRLVGIEESQVIITISQIVE